MAKDFAAELPADPNQRLYVTESITDVTARLTRGMDGVGGLKRYATIDQRSKQAAAECERDPGYRCDVYNFNGGRNYLLIKQLEIKDVRLVYAPSEQIGNFGGDVDNWMWPRHTGDFTFLRGYVGPDGKPAPYSKDNKPYQPRSWLKIDPKGLQVGDYAMVAGYPARTNRSRLAEELRDAIQFSYPRGIKNMGEALDTIARMTKDRPDAAIKYASTVQSLSNGWKNQQGQLEGFAKTTAVADKEAEEARLLAWIDADAGRTAKYGRAVTALKAELARIRSLRETELYGNSLLSMGPTLYGAARDLYKLSRERRKADAERSFGFQARDEIKFKGRMAVVDKRYDAEVDRALFELALGRYLGLDKVARIPELDDALGIDRDGMTVTDLDAALDRLCANTTRRPRARMAARCDTARLREVRRQLRAVGRRDVSGLRTHGSRVEGACRQRWPVPGRLSGCTDCVPRIGRSSGLSGCEQLAARHLWIGHRLFTQGRCRQYRIHDAGRCARQGHRC
jgi:hypothetical protein